MDRAKVLNRLKELLDEKKYKYDMQSEDFMVNLIFTTDDIDMNHLIIVQEKFPVVKLISRFPFKFGEDQMIYGIIAVNLINSKIYGGFFNIETDGKIYYNNTITHDGNTMNNDQLEYLLNGANYVVDKYNDALYDLSRGSITIKQFRERTEL